MKLVNPAAIRDALLLSFAAGGADAAGYIGLGRVFTSNMTGNLVLFGIYLGQRHFSAAIRALFVLAVFVLGACFGAWLGRGIDGQNWPRLARRLVGIEAVLLVLFAVGWSLGATAAGPVSHFRHALLPLLTLAMGIQAAALHQLSLPGVRTTAVTGTLTTLVAGIVHLFSTSPEAHAPAGTSFPRVGFQALVVLLYAGGAVLSGVLMLHAPRWTGCGPAVAVLFVALCHTRKN
jgi:uncharacterized membrane protein YoaK (UPF0700 family)